MKSSLCFATRTGIPFAISLIAFAAMLTQAAHVVKKAFPIPAQLPCTSVISSDDIIIILGIAGVTDNKTTDGLVIDGGAQCL